MKTMTDFMFDLEQILKTCAERYPLMQPTDAVKLIYQNEFGGGHLISDEAAVRRYLQIEYDSVPKDPTRPLYESIGNGIVRVHLAAVTESDIPRLADRLICSAALHKGDMERFLEKLQCLRELTKQGIFSFGIDALEEYLDQYAKAGYPAVSHSPEYRAAYQPAYRIVLENL